MATFVKSLIVSKGLVQSGTHGNPDLAADVTVSGDVSLSTHKLTNVVDPTASTDAATKAYVDAVAQGLAPKAPVQAMTAAALPANIYANGASGVGATLTGVSVGALTVDGYAVAVGDRVGVNNEAAASHNGIYKVTTVGSVAVVYVLTRATDMDTAAEVPGAYVFALNGTVNVDQGFVVNSAGPYTIGTTAISFTQFTGAADITAGTGLGKTGNTLSLANTAVTPATYGDATHVGQFTVDQQGRITGASNVPISGGSTDLSLVTLTADATVVIGCPVYPSASGHFDKANSGSGFRFIGFATAAITSSTTGVIQTGGVLTLTTGQWDAVAGTTGGLAAGTLYYLTASSGVIDSLPAGDWSVPVGLALSTTKMLIVVDRPLYQGSPPPTLTPTPQWYGLDIDYTSLSAGLTDNTTIVLTMSKFTYIHALSVRLVTAVAGGSLSNYQVQWSVFDNFGALVANETTNLESVQTVTDDTVDVEQVNYFQRYSGYTLRFRAQSTGDTLNNATQGAWVVGAMLSLVP